MATREVRENVLTWNALMSACRPGEEDEVEEVQRGAFSDADVGHVSSRPFWPTETAKLTKAVPILCWTTEMFILGGHNGVSPQYQASIPQQ